MASLSTTGTDIRAALAVAGNTLPDDDDVFLAILNWAIRSAWPSDRITERVIGAATLTSGQFDYSLAGLTNPPARELGISLVFIQESGTTTAPDVSHDTQQYYDGSADAWYLRFSPRIVNGYTGKSVNVVYQYPHPEVTDLDEATFCDQPLLIAIMERWVTKNMMAEQNIDKSTFGPLYDRVFQEERIRRQQLNIQQLGTLKTIQFPQRLR